MALNKEQQKQVAMAVVAVVLFGYVYVNKLLKPVRAQIATRESELASVNGRIQGLRATANQLDQLLKRVEELKIQVAAVEKRLPREENLQDIIRIVSTLAEKSGVRYSSFARRSDQAVNLFTEIPIDLSISGSVFSIGKFLAALGQQERIMSARNVNLNAGADPKKNQTVTGTFTLLAFIYNG